MKGGTVHSPLNLDWLPLLLFLEKECPICGPSLRAICLAADESDVVSVVTSSPGIVARKALPLKLAYFSLKPTIKEEARLVATIEQIDKAVGIIPRGAFLKTPHGSVHENRNFEGKFSLSISE